MRKPRRPYRESDRPRVQELIEQGKTHAEIAKETGVSERTVSRWLSEGLLSRPSPIPVAVARENAREHEPGQEWTACELLELGMDPAEAVRILELLDRTATVSTPRFREWLSTYVPLTAKIPDEWAATVAFLPILGRDLHNPALGTLVELMHEFVPWEDEQLRRRYGEKAMPLLRDARIELNDWLIFVSNPETVAVAPVEEAAVIMEALRRLPHVDRPIRRRRPVHEEDKRRVLHLVREMPMGALTLCWSRLLDGSPPWFEAYGDYTRETQDPHETIVVQVDTLVFGGRSWLEWPRRNTRWSR